MAYELLVAAHGTQFPDQGSNPDAVCWECGVLAMGTPGRSLHVFLICSQRDVTSASSYSTVWISPLSLRVLCKSFIAHQSSGFSKQSLLLKAGHMHLHSNKYPQKLKVKQQHKMRLSDLLSLQTQLKRGVCVCVCVCVVFVFWFYMFSFDLQHSYIWRSFMQ